MSVKIEPEETECDQIVTNDFSTMPMPMHGVKIKVESIEDHEEEVEALQDIQIWENLFEESRRNGDNNVDDANSS